MPGSDELEQLGEFHLIGSGDAGQRLLLVRPTVVSEVFTPAALAADRVDHLATPGSVVLAPRNVVHSDRTAGDSPARMLFLYSPPGMEGMFPERGRPGVRGALPPPLEPADLVAMAAVAGKYRFSFVVPE